MNEKQRTEFLNKLKANVQEYRELDIMDEKAVAAFDAKKIRQDWEKVGNYIQSSIGIAKEQNEK